MSKTIWKYPILAQGEFSLNLPRGAKILSVKVQRNTPYIWALVIDCLGKTEKRDFAVYGTGWDIQDKVENFTFIDTFLLDEGALVFHLFEKET